MMSGTHEIVLFGRKPDNYEGAELYYVYVKENERAT
jgi:hypothetical protein